MDGSMGRSVAALATVVVVALAVTGGARAEHASELKAREDFAAGRYHQALDMFAKLYAETLNPVYLRNIARCHQKLREPNEAIDTFRDYLAKGKTISPEERAEINGYIKEMEALRAERAEVARQAKQAAAPPPAPPPPATPAPVQPIAPAPAMPPSTGAPGRAALAPNPPADATESNASLVAKAGPPADQSSPFYARWWFWTIVGVAVAGGAVAAIALTGGTSKPDCSYPGITNLHCQ
jgi:hypothetical protein